jgi:glycosyltransferase involved in cell wall biosynthesis
MRIAQIAPLSESVPPKLYGGTERVVSWLTEELVRQGHDVTLFASGDSVTSARLVSPCANSLRTDKTVMLPLVYHFIMLEQVLQRLEQFDILHFHIDFLHYSLCRRLAQPAVTTMHGRLDLHELPALYTEFNDVPLVSISDSQREPLPMANWRATVYHGLPIDLHPYNDRAEDYLVFLGRISPEKRVDRAIEIAKRVGMKLKIAAKIAREDEEYFKRDIEHLFDDPLVEYLGELGGKDKDELLGHARALLFAIDWPEPFGLAMIESMACGTPVIAWRCGSIPEVVDEGVTGCIVDNIDQACAAVERVTTISRLECRKRFEERFSVARMAADYVSVYEALLKRMNGCAVDRKRKRRAEVPLIRKGVVV